MNETVYDHKSARKVFSRIGIAFFVFVVVGSALQLILPAILNAILGPDNWFSTSSWGMWILSFAPIYLVAFPLTILILCKIPANKYEPQKLSTRQFLTFVPMCFCLMYAGNLVGTLLSLILSGGQATNNVATLAMDNNPLKIMVIVILAPIFEELVCRKLIIDRTRQYGEKTAVLLSGLLFGLFHLNLYQFFYAFALGIIFAYIYIRTSKLIYPIILHAIINFMGSVVAPWIITKVDMDALQNLSSTSMQTEQLMETLEPMLSGLLIFMLYSCVLMSMAIWGLVLLIVKRKKAQWQEAEAQLPKGTLAKTVYLNVGMILFFIIAVVFFILALLA